jgi:release factor glutamine methyltransferase
VPAERGIAMGSPPAASHGASQDGGVACNATIGSTLRWAIPLLASSGAHSPRLDAEVLLAHVLSVSRAWLLAHWPDPLSEGSARRYRELIVRRSRGEPVAYLVGERAFYDLDLSVDRRVLIPRPETEMLVDEALRWCREAGHSCRRIADIGTGSGALAVALARHFPHARVGAVDRSIGALAVAGRNAARYGVAGRVMRVCGDLLAPLAGPLDLIVANLPYVPTERLSGLDVGVRDYEPREALDGGPDGLDVIRRLWPQAAERLAAPGLLLVEIDDGQGAAAACAARAALADAANERHSFAISVHRDHAGLERMVRVECWPQGDRWVAPTTGS